MSLSSIHPRPSARAERQFGLTVGSVLCALSGWWLFRGKFHALAPWALALGGALVLLGIVYPRALTYPNRGWMAFAEALSFVMTRVVLGIVFFLVVTPIGAVKRLTGWDPLRRRGRSSASYWAPYPERQRDHRHYERMF